MGDCHSKLQPNDLDNHEGTTPRNSAGDLIGLTRMRDCAIGPPTFGCGFAALRSIRLAWGQSRQRPFPRYFPCLVPATRVRIA